MTVKPNDMKRRRFLALSGSSLAIGLAGCTEGETSDSEYDVTVGLAGLTVDGVSPGPNERELERTIATELGVRARDVRARPDENTIEVLVDVEESEFRSALDAAGVDVADDQIRDGVTARTHEETVEVITARLDRAGIEDATVEAIDGEDTIGIDLPDDAAQDPTDLFNRGDVRLVAGYPADPDDGDEAGFRTETILTTDDFERVGEAQQTATVEQPHVPVTLTDEAAQQYAETMRDAGFTGKGLNGCAFDAEEHDEPDEPRDDQYCVYTVVDGEYVYAAGLGPSLAEQIDEGAFEADPQFILTTATMENAEDLELYLKSGSLPTEVDITAE